MGWIKRIGDSLLARKRRAAFEKSPSAEGLIQLVQCLLNVGDCDAAHDYTAHGIKTYTDNELIKELHRIATQQRARKGIEEAQAELEAHPSPHAYLKLARDSLTLRDSDAARKALEDCIAQYPDCASAFAGLAQIHERLFLWDLAGEDGNRVIRYAREAGRLNPADPDPLFHLARFFARIGALAHARRTAEYVLKMDPGHAATRAFLTALPKGPGVGEESGILSLLQQIEEKGRLPGGDASERNRIEREIIRYRAGLDELKEAMPGSRCIVIDPEGKAWGASGRGDHDAFVSLVHGLASTAQLATRRVGLGPMRAITLETAGGSVILRHGSRGTVSCLLPKGMPVRGTQQLLKRVMQAGTTETTGKGTT